MDPYALNLETWDKVAGLYQERFMDLRIYDASYAAFAECLPPEARVLEVGCGPGNVTRDLLIRRPDIRIIATDLSPAMIRLAEANNPHATCQILDARQIGTLTGPFDGILSGFCLPYLTPQDGRQFVQDAARLLSPGGTLYLSAIAGDPATSGYRQNSRGDGMYQYYYPKPLLVTWLREAGFGITTLFEVVYTPSETHLVFVCDKVSL